ncbi:Splicing factor [Lunasporangiospora selenospora]|uniref:Splicing factor n=1 Tax=Lunasporangiospora selenospora TaxID=979761 RepID=A0A9P6G268_9FUNG|nr:Splicing factor [Lunasporangiospora selenospora]
MNALWMDWIKDEQSVATSGEETKHVLDLYKRAVSDYLCKNNPGFDPLDISQVLDFWILRLWPVLGYAVNLTHGCVNECLEAIPLWKSYLEYAIDEYNDSAELDEDERVVDDKTLEKIFQNAEKHTSHHLAESHVVWNIRFEFVLQDLSKEARRFSLLSFALAKDKIDSAHKMILNRLRVPHLELDETFSKLSSLISSWFPDSYESKMVEANKLVANSRKILSGIEKFEQDLNHKAKDCDLTPRDIQKVAERAVRNCPWSGDLWELYLVVLSKDDVRGEFDRAKNYLAVAGGDPYFRLEKLWLELDLRKHISNTDSKQIVRATWEAIIRSLQTSAETWLEYALAERKIGNDAGARKVFSRACGNAKNLDWPEKVFEAWLLFEREVGTAAEYKEALLRTRRGMKIVQHERSKLAQGLDETAIFVAPTVIATANAPQPIVTAVGAKDADKKRKGSFGEGDDGHAKKVTKVEEGCLQNAVPDVEQEEPITNPSSSSSKPLDISSGRHEDTCFVANFPQSFTESALKSLFEEFGKVLRATIPRKTSGKVGFAYVQFSSPEEATAALALNGRDVGERRGLVVKISDTNKQGRAPVSKPPLPTVSRHELKITGLDNDVTQEDLRKLVTLYAEPGEITIVRSSKTNGHPWAGVKFASEENAAAALALNGTSFHGKPLEVTHREFFGNPHDRSENQEHGRAHARKRSRKGKGQDDASANNPAKPAPAAPAPAVKSAMAFFPRTLGPSHRSVVPRKAFTPASGMSAARLQSKPTTGGSAATTESSNEKKAEDVSETVAGNVSDLAPKVPKSNADFRAMFLGGKLGGPDKKTEEH